jgi:hypothetical protein
LLAALLIGFLIQPTFSCAILGQTMQDGKECGSRTQHLLLKEIA